LLLRRYSGEPRDRFTLRKLAADSSTGAVVVYAEALLDIAETASRICVLAAGAGGREVFGARPEAIGLTIAEVVHATFFQRISIVFLVIH
jgi:hypothetical protein